MLIPIDNGDVRWSVFFSGNRLVKNLSIFCADLKAKQQQCICKAKCYALQSLLCVGDDGNIDGKKSVPDHPLLDLGLGLQAP